MKIDAVKMRTLLIGLIVVLVGGGAAGGWYLQGILSSKIAETNTIKEAAANSDNDLSNAKALKVYLEKHQTDMEKAAMIVADTTSYKYQDQIVQDITTYANLSGLTILGFDFPTQKTSSAKSSSGLKTITATITLDNPVPYANYLTFIKYIEQNLTKMQITDISITPDNDDPSQISNPIIGLEVYIK
jgi:hypothetical protein